MARWTEMAATYELIPSDPSRHPVTGDLKIRQAVEMINARRFSASELDRHLKHIQELYDQRPPEVVAPLAHHVLQAALQLDAVRADGLERILAVIKERGLWIEPAESAGGRAPGIEPAETFEEFVERNKIPQQIEARAALIARVEARPLAEHGELGNGRSGKSRVDNVKSTQGGNSAEYQLRRLQRDRPDIYQRYKAGEFKSVRAACMEAGIAPALLTLTKDAITSAQRIQEQRSQDWINDLIAALSPGGLTNTESAGEIRLFLQDLEPERLRYVLSSLCTRRPEVFEQLLEDMTEDEAASEQADKPEPPVAVPTPTTTSEASSNGHNMVIAGVIKTVPALGLYGATALAKSMNISPNTLSTAVARSTDGDEILRRLTGDLPIRVLVRKSNPATERLEVIPR